MHAIIRLKGLIFAQNNYLKTKRMHFYIRQKRALRVNYHFNENPP